MTPPWVIDWIGWGAVGVPGLFLFCHTTREVLLSVYVTELPPEKRPRYKTRRGVTYLCGFTYAWPPGICIPEDNPEPEQCHFFRHWPGAPTPVGYFTVIEGTTCTLPGPSTPPIRINPIIDWTSNPCP